MTAAWHFLSDKGLLRDGSVPPPDGVELRFDGPVEICRSGLHASVRLIDALSYAPGATLCRVSCAAVELEQADKFVCRQRTIEWRVDSGTMRRVLVWFAYWCADRASAYAYASASASAADASADASAAASAAAAAAAAAYAAAAAAAAADDYAAAAASADRERQAQDVELVRLVVLARGKS